MDISTIVDQAKILAKMHIKLDKDITNILVSPHPEEIRLVEVSKMIVGCDNIFAWLYNPVPDIGLNVKSQLILISPEEWGKIEIGELALPEGWDKSSLISLYDGEDLRKTGLKNGLRQLNIKQLKRVIDYPGEMVLDDYNYSQGLFCPLGVALGLDKTMPEPSHDKVFQALTDLGYDVYNTRGIDGQFYTDHRKEDLMEAAQEVLEEKLEQQNG